MRLAVDLAPLTLPLLIERQKLLKPLDVEFRPLAMPLYFDLQHQ
jgi:hypothetical protein